MRKTIKQAFWEATEKLKESRIPTPALDAEVLLAHVLKKSREHILAHPNELLSESQILDFQSQVSRRALGEPVAYITEEKEFYGLNFFVNKNVLIPRPETELMVDETLSLLRSMLRNRVSIVDVGTGSGNIAISLARNIKEVEFPQEIKLFAIDSSRKALEIAKYNAEELGVSGNIEFLLGRFLNPLIENFLIDIQHSSLLILANLPYLSEKIYNSSPISTKNFEPQKALLSGKDGLDHYDKLLNQIKMLANENKTPITALLEISPEQKPLIIRRIKKQLPTAKIRLKKDLAEKWRMAKIQIN